MSELRPTFVQTDEDLDLHAPELEAFYTNLRAYEQLLNEVETSDTERTAVISDLDSRWPYYGDELLITGRIHTLERDPDSESSEGINYVATTKYVEDLSVISQGFTIYQEPVVVDGEVAVNRIVIGHFFDVRRDNGPESMLLSQYFHVRGAAGLDDVIVDFDAEFKSGVLRKTAYFFPDLMTDIETAMLNTEDESQAVMALKDLSITPSYDTTPEALAILSQYANTLVEFDTRVPYRIAFSGLVYHFDSDDCEESTPLYVESLELLGYPIGIQIIPAMVPRDGYLVSREGSYCFALRFEALGQDTETDAGSIFMLPLQGDELYISSVRLEHYGDMRAS